MKTVTLSRRLTRNWEPRKVVPLIALLFVCFALLPRAYAVSPAPDGGYPNENTAEGDGALFSLTSGGNNTAIGANALYNNTTGSGNTANGVNALYFNNSDNNTANGINALVFNTGGNNNTANGAFALASNTTGGGNTANGASALAFNTTGGDNVANGASALYNNTTGGDNVANGASALYNNTTGGGNTANGASALYNNTAGSENTATGINTLYFNQGSSNTATGAGALVFNGNGNNNTATGASALTNNVTGAGNTANGASALNNNTTGNSNIALGVSAGVNLTTGSSNIDIGSAGVAAEANTIRIGTVGTQTSAFIAGVYQTNLARGIAVVIDSTGHLGTKGSSERFKTEINPMDKASEAILALKPVTFHYKKELDPEGIRQFGLVAEEVEKVNPDLVARDAQGKVYTVRYDAVNAMLLNEFLKEHRKVLKLEAEIAQQRKDFQAAVANQQQEIKCLAATVKDQAALIQKVSAQIEIGRGTRVVGNRQ